MSGDYPLPDIEDTAKHFHFRGDIAREFAVILVILVQSTKSLAHLVKEYFGERIKVSLVLISYLPT